MASIEDIRVNGQPSSSLLTPTVAGGQTVLSWDFVEDAASWGQKSFQIMVGRTTSNWGYGAFLADVYDTTTIPDFAASTATQFVLPRFDRGVHYYGQVIAYDQDDNLTDWAKFQFTLNQLPYVVNARITPEFPTSADDLTLTYDYYDADNHDESGTKVRWFKNNLWQREYNDLFVLPSAATNPGDSWTAKIAPSDGIEFGATVETEAVVIKEIDADFSDLTILPEDPNVDDLLRVDFTIQEGEYLAMSTTTIIEWYKNGVLVPESNSTIIRLSLEPGDQVYAKVKLMAGDSVITQKQSESKVIADVKWNVFDLTVSGLSDASNVTSLSPILEWRLYKSTAEKTDRPEYLNVLVTKTPSTDGAIYDSGFVEYLADAFVIPENVLKRGQRYYVHVAATDTNTAEPEDYALKEIQMAGSSWSENVDNSEGWTVEFKCGLDYTDAELGALEFEPNLGIYIHDGTKFCVVKFALRSITFLSDTSLVYTYPASEPAMQIMDNTGGKTFRICGKNSDLRVYMNNRLVIDAVGLLTNQSNLKFIEFGDIDGKNTNKAKFTSFRYSTDGAYGLDPGLPDQNTFYFNAVGTLNGGSIEFIFDNLLSWTPDDASESTKLIRFNESSKPAKYPTVTMNRSPITSIQIDSQRNKFIGTASGVIGIYGEKHDPDYQLLTNAPISPAAFDRITSVPSDKLTAVEPSLREGWLTIDTTYRTIGTEDHSFGFRTGDEYDPYLWAVSSHAIHYYSQRTQGQAWYDQVDNAKGWQVAFSFDLDLLEADDYAAENMHKSGFGIYVNDGKYQEIIYFYEDRIRLFYANVYVPVVTTVSRDYAIRGKGNSIWIYQKLTSSASGSYQLLVDGAGLFTTPASQSTECSQSKTVIDGNGTTHAVWTDSGDRRSRIMYSSHDGERWSEPEVVCESSKFSLESPCLDVDTLGRVWVAFEDTSFGPTEISVSVKDNAGWNPKTRLTNADSVKGNPDIKVDTRGDVHVVWHDNRDGLYKIFAARWDSQRQAWLSSAQFGEDEPVMQYKANDPYQTGHVVEFMNAKMAVLDPFVVLVCEALLSDTGRSRIYGAQYTINDQYWIGSGTILTDSTGEFAGVTEGILLSPLDSEYATNPCIAGNPVSKSAVVAWESHDDVVSQIWAMTIDNSLVEVSAPAAVTAEASDCTNPSMGMSRNCAILTFIKDEALFTNLMPFTTQTWGAAQEITLDAGKSVVSSALPSYTPGTSLFVLYDFSKAKDSTLESKEQPEGNCIGAAAISSADGLSVLSDEQVNSSDLKEMAFGDFSENVGLRANIKDVAMYFGYDARPQSIYKYNSSTISAWPDDRVNDLFVDAYGNIIAGTFGGLVYYNVYSAQLTKVGGTTLAGKLITSVKWGGNGIWYIGTTNGMFYSKDAGRTWSELASGNLSGKIINRVSVTKSGEALVAAVQKSASTGEVTASYVYIAHPDRAIVEISLAQIGNPNVKCVEMDDNDIIWAGCDEGLVRIENRSQFIVLSRANGMRSSHVNDIAIVNKHLRFVATATGVERMNGLRFTNFNVKTHSLLNDNIATLKWDSGTQSLWVASLHTLHEIVFRDPVYDIVEDEVAHYTSDLGTESDYDDDTFYLLDYSAASEKLTTESASVYLNKNKVDFGYAIDPSGSAVQFVTSLLPSDQVEIEISNRFTQYHDFNQSEIEKSVVGEKRTIIRKMGRTGYGNQLILLSSGDKHNILLDSGLSSLPFATIVIDRKPPWGCIQKIDSLSRTKLRFRIKADDDLSGVDSYILSNYENGTSDGTTPLPWSPIESIVDHDLGEGINNVFESLTFDGTVTIGPTTYTVGEGSALAVRQTSNRSYLYAATSAPIVVYMYDPDTNEWSAISVVDESDHAGSKQRVVNDFIGVGTVLYMTTGLTGGNGEVYTSTNGQTFYKVGSVSGEHAKGIAVGPNGMIYFGSSDGKIYAYGKKDGKTTTFSEEYDGVGNSVHSLGIHGETLFAGTGSKGRLYTINLRTGDNLIVFDAPDTAISRIHIKDADASASDSNIYLAGNDYTTIYRAKVADLDFIRSYTSYGNKIEKIIQVYENTLDQDATDSTGKTVAVAAVGKSVLKQAGAAWEYVYGSDEEIKDIVEYSSAGVGGVWIMTPSAVTKWTAVVSEKKVYLRLKDKAGNISTLPVNQTGAAADGTCPDPQATDTTDACCYIYSIKIEDLKDFVNEGRIVDVDEYGSVTYSYDSPSRSAMFSGDRIDEEVGYYVSEVFNGSNDLVAWRSMSWQTVEPVGTEVRLQIRSGVTESNCRAAEWSADLVKDVSGNVSLEHITDQYIQYRATLTSRIRDLSPSLTSVTLRNLTSQASHFFTTNFVLPSRPIKGLLTANTVIPVSSDIVFGINTKNSVDFGDYQIIEPNRIFTVNQSQFGSNLRIGAKLLSPGIPQLTPTYNPGDPYDAASFVCSMDFEHTNLSGSSVDYHFRAKFYNDIYRTQQAYVFFSGNDQTGWHYDGDPTSIFPSSGLTIGNGATRSVSFDPIDRVATNQKWYVTIEAWNSTIRDYEEVSTDHSFICSSCNITQEDGLVAEYYRTGLSALTQVPDFSSFTADYVFTEPDINFAATAGAWTSNDPLSGSSLSTWDSQFAIRIRGKLLVPETGSYEMYLESDDGSMLYVDNSLVLDNNGVHDIVEVHDTVQLNAGLHDIEVQYFRGTGTAELKLSWVAPGGSKVVIPSAQLFHSLANEYCTDSSSPVLNNLGIQFELENGEVIKINARGQ